MKLTLLIPIYNHDRAIVNLLHKLADANLPCIIVDDGSDEKTKAQLAIAQTQFSWITVLTLAHNAGKGAALLHGFDYAQQQGYTHALQIDADHQHNTDDIPAFIQQAKKYPQALISGHPIYDASIPKSRLYGRKITNFWVAIETLSLSLPEAMCGFRVYPLAPTLDIMHHQSVAKRMGFDIDILVRLYWRQVPIQYIPTRVTYPEQGVSHFRLIRDNLLISCVHTRLFFTLFLHAPKLISSKIRNYLSVPQVGQ
jgi:glycosyltransferase involved in cell wall biosynthesis